MTVLTPFWRSLQASSIRRERFLVSTLSGHSAISEPEDISSRFSTSRMKPLPRAGYPVEPGPVPGYQVFSGEVDEVSRPLVILDSDCLVILGKNHGAPYCFFSFFCGPQGRHPGESQAGSRAALFLGPLCPRRTPSLCPGPPQRHRPGRSIRPPPPEAGLCLWHFYKISWRRIWPQRPPRQPPSRLQAPAPWRNRSRSCDLPLSHPLS